MRLLDRVCVMTGASRGIGRAMALGFAREGADIVIAARTEVQKDERLPGTIHSVAEEGRWPSGAVPCIDQAMAEQSKLF